MEFKFNLKSFGIQINAECIINICINVLTMHQKISVSHRYVSEFFFMVQYRPHFCSSQATVLHKNFR